MPAPRVLRLRDLTTNAVETLDPLPCHPRRRQRPRSQATRPAPTGDFGIKAHFEDVDGPRDAIELFGVRGSYGGLAAIEGGRWNAAFSVPAARLKSHRGDVDALFAEVTRENPVLARRLARAKRTGDWLAAPLPRFAVRTEMARQRDPRRQRRRRPGADRRRGHGAGDAERGARRVGAARGVGTQSARRLRASTESSGAPAVRAAAPPRWRSRRLAIVDRVLALGSLSVPLVRAALGLLGKSNASTGRHGDPAFTPRSAVLPHAR